MKKFNKIIAIISILGISLTYSCKKDNDLGIDCAFELGHVHLDHSIDADNSKKAILEVSYTGEYTLDNSMEWNFGDGVTQTLNGKSQEHTYSDLGTYTVKAKVTLRHGDHYCSTEKSETVKIQ